MASGECVLKEFYQRINPFWKCLFRALLLTPIYGSWLGDSEEGWEIYQMSKKLALNEKKFAKDKVQSR